MIEHGKNSKAPSTQPNHLGQKRVYGVRILLIFIKNNFSTITKQSTNSKQPSFKQI